MRSLFDRVKNQLAFRSYESFRFLWRLANDFTPRRAVSARLIETFRQQLAKQDSKIFQWALHEADGRSQFFAIYDPRAWLQWLSMLRYGHFQWNAPPDALIAGLRSSIRNCGRETWSRLFKRYLIAELDWHDLYSLPDVYYMTKTLGRFPKTALDIGGGWGRLAMSWRAVGVPIVCVTDAIEQAYAIQHEYMASIPRCNFVEAIFQNDANVFDFSKYDSNTILHFPLWDLLKLPDKSIEAVSTIQVLREVRKECVEFLLTNIKRILKPGGIFYVRDNDHEYKEKCMHNVQISDVLCKMGFKMITFDLVQGRDIHGVPRIFQL